MLNYDMPLYRPPSEGNNLIIQATLGCSFNQCSFCSMYKSKQYQARPLTTVLKDIEEAATHQPNAQRVFLADGDALALPMENLLPILDRLAESLPRLSRVSCYATPANILHKSPQELTQLRERKLSLLYLGVESGDNRILKRITKGATQRSIRRAMERAAESRMKVSATVILGLGGQNHWREHIDGTLELLNSAPTSYLSTLQLYLEEEAVTEFAEKFGEPFLPQDDTAILEEQKRLIAGLTPPTAVIFRSNHASNALALAGNLPRDRIRLLDQIKAAQAGAVKLRENNLRRL
ncbi:MAG: radical SAM protein [Candidatus Sedimenticola sp. (ex Thyasira tokunagai)]